MTLTSLTTGFWANRRGSISTEFAFVVPIAFLMLIGIVELTSAYEAERRASAAAGTLGDIVARQTKVTSQSLSDLLNASSALLADTSADSGSRVSALALEDDGQTGVVLWSKGEPGTLARRNESERIQMAEIADGPMKCAHDQAILAEVQVTYWPRFGMIFDSRPVTIIRKSLFCPRSTTGTNIEYGS